ncbi:MAG: beta-galactosidase trimerization domain-containing protein, partial [Chloroflexi bacterium]|nr:beta-galactosidase trimerization domain-containing protein [Chloroflexota bacterium]
YYHTFNSEPIARDHPEWLERDAEGKEKGISVCLLSPLVEEWMLPHIVEIITNYDVDGMFFDGTYAYSLCYCESCRKRFAEASGGLAIPQDKQDANAARYISWRLEQFTTLRQQMTDTIHAYRPEVAVSFNWAYSPRSVEVVPAGVDNLVADIYTDDQVFNGSYFSRYWATLERPFDIMNVAFLQWWGDWGCKPAIALQQEEASVIANGGLVWLGYQMNQAYDVEPAAMGELGKALAFVKEREPLLGGAEPIPYAAVLHATTTPLTQDEPGLLADERTLRGAHRLLTEDMIPFHFLNEETLLRRLSEYKVVILADQRYLAPELVKALEAWVNAGGVLIATALTGTLDSAFRPTGSFALESLLGVHYDGIYDQAHAYIEITEPRLKAGALDMAHLVEAVSVFAKPMAADVQVLARLRKIYLRSDGKFLLRWSPVGEDSGYPAITSRPVGKGYAAYIANEIFRAYQVKNQWTLKPLIANLLRMMAPEPLVDVSAPAWVEVTLMRQRAECSPSGRERTLVHLVNQHGDHAVDGNSRCTEQILPVRNIQVQLRVNARPSRVTLEPDSSPASWSYAESIITVAVPEVFIHRVVAVEF